MQSSRRRFLSFLPLAALTTSGCWSPAPPGPAGTFRFAVFGDGLYSWNENGRFRRVTDALVDMGQHFPKPVLVIHGDEHKYRVDRPFRDPGNGATVGRLQRLETFGSPDIGWVDVVVDTALPEPFRFEPNVMPGWMWW